MKRQTMGVLSLTLAGIGFLSGCAFGNATSPISVPPPVSQTIQEQKKEISTLKQVKQVNGVKMISYTSKNGLLSFEYPEITYMSGEIREKELAKVVVNDIGDMVTVGPEGYKNANYLTLVSKKDIEKKDVDAFVQKIFGDKNCKIVFEGEGVLLRGATNAALMGEDSDCSLMNMEAWYDAGNKVFFMKNTGKLGDFFTIKGEDPVGTVNDSVHESIRFPYLKNVSSNIYENKEFGFGFSFPDTWKGYSVKERILTAGDYENIVSFDFGFGNEHVFNLSVHSKEAWKKILAEEGPRPQYLGENDIQVFGYSMAQDGSSEVYKRWSEVPLIFKSFEVK